MKVELDDVLALGISPHLYNAAGNWTCLRCGETWDDPCRCSCHEPAP